MQVDRLHLEYEAHCDGWRTWRDVMEGDEAMKAAGERYLRGLDDQSEAEFVEYVKRGFFHRTGRTVTGYVGMVFRKEPVVVLGSKVPARFSLDVDLRGSSLAGYCKRVVEETILMGRCGTLVDFEGAKENRAYFSFYAPENILNW